MAQLISGALSTFSFPTTASLAEAYHNGKYFLTKNYINRQYRWSSMVNGFLGAFIIAIAPLLANIAGSFYANAIIMIQIMVGFRFIEVLTRVNDTVLIASGKPEYTILGILAEQTVRIASLFVMLKWIPQLAGLSFVISMGLGWTIKWVVSFLLVKKRLPGLKINQWQSVVIPVGAAIVEIFLLVMGQYYLLPWLSIYMHPILASIILIIAGLIVGPFLIFFPFHALLGAGMQRLLRHFRKS